MTNPSQTKIASVQAFMACKDGASLAAIGTATGSQAHSARAALSGFCKAGHVIERADAEDPTAGSVYRITSVYRPSENLFMPKRRK